VFGKHILKLKAVYIIIKVIWWIRYLGFSILLLKNYVLRITM